MSVKNTLTPPGIEPATFRFVAQHLNHCATAVPGVGQYISEISLLYSIPTMPSNDEVKCI